MTVYKRGNVYWYDFWRDGKRYLDSTGLRNYRKAADVEIQAKDDVARGVYHARRRAKVPTFSEYVGRVMDLVKLKHANKPRSVEFYQQTYNKILLCTAIADSRLGDIDEAKLSDFCIEANKSGLMPATINRRLACIRKALRLAKEEKYIHEVPKFTMLEGERKREFVLEGELRDEFISGLPEPTRPLALFLCEAPLRITECCRLKWERVYATNWNGEERLLIKVEEGKSKKSERFLPLTKEAQKIVEEQRKVSRSEYVFVRYGPRVERCLQFIAPISRHTVSQQFTERRKEMGLPWDCVLHSTRHTALTDLAQAGAGVFTVMGAAGHSTPDMSERYVHHQIAEMMRAFDRMTEYRSAKTKKVVPTNFPTGNKSDTAGVGK